MCRRWNKTFAPKPSCWVCYMCQSGPTAFELWSFEPIPFLVEWDPLHQFQLPKNQKWIKIIFDGNLNLRCCHFNFNNRKYQSFLVQFKSTKHNVNFILKLGQEKVRQPTYSYQNLQPINLCTKSLTIEWITLQHQITKQDFIWN